MAGNDQSFPLFPPKSTEHRLLHFDDTVFNTDPSSTIYKLIDAFCGDAGAASLKKESFMTRLDAALETMSFSDLDFVFGNIAFLVRSPYESYPYNPMQDMLTSDQWDEIRVKDAWYRDRVRKFFIACGLGGTPDGMRMATLAAISSDCDIYEVWRLMDNFGLTGTTITVGNNGPKQLGRAPVPSRQEVVISPHKTTISGQESRLLKQMLKRIAPVDSIITVNPGGVAMRTPLAINAAAADSSYFQVEKMVTATPILKEIPAPDLLAIDLLPTEQWLFKSGSNLAPYAAYNISQEYGYYYLIGGGARSPIDSVTYGTLGKSGGYSESYLPEYGSAVPSTIDAVVTPEATYQAVRQLGEYSPWQTYPLADSPDNYPGGKYGLTPQSAPALNPDRSAYVFPYQSQAAYVALMQAAIVSAGGVANDLQFRLSLTPASSTKIDYVPELAVAYNAPTKDSTVTSSWNSGKKNNNFMNLFDPTSFIKG